LPLISTAIEDTKGTQTRLNPQASRFAFWPSLIQVRGKESGKVWGLRRLNAQGGAYFPLLVEGGEIGGATCETQAAGTRSILGVVLRVGHLVPFDKPDGGNKGLMCGGAAGATAPRLGVAVCDYLWTTKSGKVGPTTLE
jgi:hypothetical protein